MKILRHIDPYPLLSFLVPLGIYLLTLAPSVTFFDSGEFLTAIHSLGAAHSPGYPTFINYCYPFTLLPLGSIAFRINFATAFSAGLASLGVYLLTVTLLRSGEPLPKGVPAGKLAALGAAVLFACSPRIWLQSNHDKPYPLISFLSAMIFFLVLRWREGREEGEERPGCVYLATFIWGIAFAAHQTMVLLLPPLAYLIVSAEPRLHRRLKEIIVACFFCLLGLAVHLHLPLRALRNPLLNWGDSDSWSQFVWGFLRRGYPTEKPERSLGLVYEQIKAFNPAREFTWVGVVLLVFALIFLFRRYRDFVVAYLIGVAAFLAVIVGYLNTPFDLIFLTEEFFSPLYLLTAVLIGLGTAEAVALLFTEWRLPDPRKGTLVAGALALALPAWQCGRNYYVNDQHNNYMAHDYATNSLRSLPQNGILFTWGDSGAFPLWYVQGVERLREDAALLHTPHLVFDWYLDGFPDIFTGSELRRVPEQARQAEAALMQVTYEQMFRRPIALDFSTRYSIPYEPLVIGQQGLVYPLFPPRTPLSEPDLSVWRLYSERGLYGGMGFTDLDTGKAIVIYATAHLEAGDTLLTLGRPQAGLAEIRRALAISPELKPQATSILTRFGMSL